MIKKIILYGLHPLIWGFKPDGELYYKSITGRDEMANFKKNI